ncbi:MAG TPA: hypothetical protein VF720_05420, partial [Candidatus Eisenbacteria bacterium]
IVDPDRSASFARHLGAMIGEDNAEAVWHEALGRPDPERVEALTSLGYLRGSAAESAPPIRRHPLDELPKWLDTQRSKSLIKLAFMRLNEERAGEAARLLDQAISLDKGFADAWFLRARARAETGDRKGALNDLHACLERDPKHVGARNELARLRSTPVDQAERDVPSRLPGGGGGTVVGSTMATDGAGGTQR